MRRGPAMASTGAFLAEYLRAGDSFAAARFASRRGGAVDATRYGRCCAAAGDEIIGGARCTREAGRFSHLLGRSPVLNFLPSPSVLLAYTAAGLLLAATPGPDMALFLSRTLTGGRRFGFAALAGAMAGLVVARSNAAALGLSALLAASAQAYGAVKLIGAAYLLWLAYGALRHGSALRLEGGGPAQRSLAATFLTGLGINLTNPKIIIFFVTFLPQFVEAGDSYAAGKFLFLGLYFLVLGAVFLHRPRFSSLARLITAARSYPRDAPSTMDLPCRGKRLRQFASSSRRAGSGLPKLRGQPCAAKAWPRVFPPFPYFSDWSPFGPRCEPVRLLDVLAARAHLIVEAAREAGAIALKFYRRGEPTSARIDYKAGGSPVTEADLAVDAFLRARLGALLPDAGWLSEETEDDLTRLAHASVLVVDPIDGTRGFLSGDPHWAVSIALVVAGRPVAGAYRPCPGARRDLLRRAAMDRRSTAALRSVGRHARNARRRQHRGAQADAGFDRARGGGFLRRAAQNPLARLSAWLLVASGALDLGAERRKSPTIGILPPSTSFWRRRAAGWSKRRAGRSATTARRPAMASCSALRSR